MKLAHICLVIVLAGVVCLAVAIGQAGTKTIPAPTEIAVLAGTVADGETIPLPRFADGTEAIQDQCQWIVSPKDVGTAGIAGDVVSQLHCLTFPEGSRVVRVYATGAPPGSAIYPGTANYMIIACRYMPVSVQESSWGRVKTTF